MSQSLFHFCHYIPDWCSKFRFLNLIQRKDRLETLQFEKWKLIFLLDSLLVQNNLQKAQLKLRANTDSETSALWNFDAAEI